MTTMPINEFSVSKALLEHLKTISGLPPISQDNAAFEPIVGQPYLREQDYSGMTQAPTLAADGFQRKDGLYRVGVFVPKNEYKDVSTGIKYVGKWRCLEFCDTIIAGFARGTVLTHAGQKVRIEQSDREQGFVDGEFYQCGIMVRYTVIN
jgi:hypothetical protein